MDITRRAFVGEVGAVGLLGGCSDLCKGAPRHCSDYDGIRIGAITYSFSQMPEFPQGCTKKFIKGANLGSVELMDRDFERDLGIVPFRHIQAKFLSKLILKWSE